MAFWWRLLSGSDWSHLLSVVSPSLFDVVSARELSRRAAALARNWFDRDGYLDCVACVSRAVAEAALGLDVVAVRPIRSLVPFKVDASVSAGPVSPTSGSTLLRLFFAQILGSDTVLLDLRTTRFFGHGPSGHQVFYPLPLWARWDPAFLEGIRLLYRGFYGDDPSLFHVATRSLGVSVADEVFLRAFGGQAKHASRYSIAGFRSTFHEVFVRCREAKVALHPDFITLGIMLATLYDHLEQIGEVQDVQAAYRAVVRPPPCHSLGD